MQADTTADSCSTIYNSNGNSFCARCRAKSIQLCSGRQQRNLCDNHDADENGQARPSWLFFVVLGTHANSGTRQEQLITRHYVIREQKLMPAIKLLSCLLRSFIMGRYHPFCRFIFARAELSFVLCRPSAPRGSLCVLAILFL